MEHHATIPQDEGDDLQAVIHDLREENKTLKSQIFNAAGRDILGPGASKVKGLAGAQHARKSDQKPASGFQALDTSSARQQPASRLPAGLEKKSGRTSDVHTTSPLQDPPKPQRFQGTAPAPSSKIQPDSKANSKPVAEPRTPATKAERFPLLATGRRPDLPSTGPWKLTMPVISNPRPVLEDIAARRQRVARQKAEGTLPELSEECRAKLASFNLQLPNRTEARRREEVREVPGPFVVEYPDEEDDEDQDVTSGLTTEDLYDMSDHEASGSRRAAIPIVKDTELTKVPDTTVKSKGEGHGEPEAILTLPKAPEKLKVNQMSPQ